MAVALLGLLAVSRQGWDWGETVPNWEAGTGRLPYEFHPDSQLSRKSRLVILSPSAEMAPGSRTLLLMHWLHLGRLGNPDSAAFRELRAVWAVGCM